MHTLGPEDCVEQPQDNTIYHCPGSCNKVLWQLWGNNLQFFPLPSLGPWIDVRQIGKLGPCEHLYCQYSHGRSKGSPCISILCKVFQNILILDTCQKLHLVPCPLGIGIPIQWAYTKMLYHAINFFY